MSNTGKNDKLDVLRNKHGQFYFGDAAVECLKRAAEMNDRIKSRHTRDISAACQSSNKTKRVALRWVCAPVSEVISILFFVGSSTDARQQRVLESEAVREGDIVVLNITEDRHNLSLKFLLGARWILEYCSPDSATIVKIDADILVNVYALSSYVNSNVMWLTGIHCVVYKNIAPVRKRTSEWYVSKDDYTLEVYPNYCAGDAYFMKPALLSAIVDAAVLVPYFWIEDVYVTGIVGDFANVNLVDISGHVILSKPRNLLRVSATTLFVNTRLARLSDNRKSSLWKDILQRNKSMQREYRKNVEVYYRSVG
ncbi:hypothetical protein HPB51_005235 [Rhipicephalus microplus]|uniref:Hexosyltransferase n=1 Tax=Rhipicephalus microplus TaxID=6941 RepID=A0A9J6EXE4_RHIMP|nr:hypothetical protein HPB51_005235 [Rhipicephalus microplus]